MKCLTIRKPDDWHLHLREGAYLKTTVAHASASFGRAIIMPNLSSPIIDIDRAIAYRQAILQAVPQGRCFEPLMTLYLNASISPDVIKQAKASGLIAGCKLYPQGVTTRSEQGVKNLHTLYKTFETMQLADLPLLIHGEVSAAEVDIFDREKQFLAQELTPLLNDFPRLRIVLEHITTKEAVDFVREGSPYLAATITAHHLYLNRNHLLKGGLKPHYYCLPLAKREEDRQALIQAATSGNAKFFIGTDSAPHAKTKKESSCACAGIYTSHAAIPLYARIFEQANALSKLEAFTSVYGPQFYRLPLNKETITLEKNAWKVPDTFAFGQDKLVPFQAGENLAWRVRAC